MSRLAVCTHCWWSHSLMDHSSSMKPRPWSCAAAHLLHRETSRLFHSIATIDHVSKVTLPPITPHQVSGSGSLTISWLCMPLSQRESIPTKWPYTLVLAWDILPKSSTSGLTWYTGYILRYGKIWYDINIMSVTCWLFCFWISCPVWSLNLKTDFYLSQFKYLQQPQKNSNCKKFILWFQRRYNLYNSLVRRQSSSLSPGIGPSSPRHTFITSEGCSKTKIEGFDSRSMAELLGQHSCAASDEQQV